MSSFSPVGSNSSVSSVATEAAVRAFLARRPDTLLGKAVPFLRYDYLPRPQWITMPPRDRLRHVYAVGGTGSGKTNFLLNLIADDIDRKRSMCVVDLRGDLVDRVLRRLAVLPYDEAARRLVLIDLRDERNVVPNNPLMGPGDAYNRALHVLSVLRQEAESWGVQLEETLRNSLIALAGTGWTLLEVEPLLSNPAFRHEVMAEVRDPHVRNFFLRYGELSEERQSAWRLPVLNKVTPLLSMPRLRRMFGLRQALPLGQILDAPGRIVLVSLGVDRLHRAAHLAGGLLISSLQNAMMARVDLPERQRRPVMLYVDEVEAVATERFETIVAEGRRFGLGLTLSHQNLAQLPTGLREVIRNNVQTQLFFQTGAGDAASLAAEAAGDRKREDVAAAIMRQGVGEAVLVRRGQPACRIRVPRYDDPAVENRAVARAMAAGYARGAVKAADADAELAARQERLENLLSGAERPTGGGYEVRYERARRV